MRQLTSRYLATIALCLVPALATAHPIAADSGEQLYSPMEPFAACCCDAQGHSLKEGRPDSHAPAGLMGDHVHHQGEVMIEYKFQKMFMDGNRYGTQQVSDVAALDVTGIPFMATPTRMDMNMQMLHVMYGATDNVTLYLMPMWMELTMDHMRRNGTTFTTYNEGFSDLRFGALFLLYDTESTDWIFNFGMSAPTGNIHGTTTAASPMGAETQMPYPMQLGSGTFNFRPGITYKKYWDMASTGVQLQTNLPVGENYRDYTVGNEYQLNWWFARRVGEQMSFSFRTEGLWRENYGGPGDPQLNPNMISTARTDMRGGFWFNLGIGGIYQFCDGSRLNVELVRPVYQDLDGVQLETDFQMFASWSKAW
ncbi:MULTISPECIES: transporter [Pirellulaceae]|uniref:transporter n=1 Tax=Pirellulaceae TaxID=2691357 RepID=UPI001E658008|nr:MULTISPECIES: transporter [Pirellulaceae]